LAALLLAAEDMHHIQQHHAAVPAVQQWWRRRALWSAGLICLAQLCMVLGGATVVQWNELLMQRECARRNIPFPSEGCNESKEAQRAASLREGWMNMAVAIPNFLTIGVISSIADAFGRKPAILLSLGGQAVLPLCIWLIPLAGHVCLHGGAGAPGSGSSSGSASDGDEPGSHCVENFWVVLGITALSSFTGGGQVCINMMFAVLGDLSIGWQARERTRAYVVLEFFQWCGSTLGPLTFVAITVACGGLLRAGFGFSFGVLAVACSLVLLSPESLEPARRVRFSWWRAGPVSQLRIFCEHSVLRRLALIWGPPLCLGSAFMGASLNLCKYASFC
jgi:MFS family permease